MGLLLDYEMALMKTEKDKSICNDKNMQIDFLFKRSRNHAKYRIAGCGRLKWRKNKQKIKNLNI